MKKSFIIALHAGFWSCYCVLLLILFLATFQHHPGGPSISYIVKLSLGFVIIPSITSFYIFYSVIFPKYLNLKNSCLALPWEG